MSYPRTYRSFRRSGDSYPWTLVPSVETLPDTLKPLDIIIRVQAVALNFRDAAMLHEGKYPVPVDPRGISASDCAAEVVAVGNDVTRFAVGDRVAPTINLLHLTDSPEERDLGDVDVGGRGSGVLAEYAVFEEKHLVKLPTHLSWEEAATITCAGTTAWNALNALQGPKQGTSALLQGTGGVSMFALLICLAAGIRPIITSSSDEKLRGIQEISSDIQVINYKKTSDIPAEVLRLTDGKGVDYLVNNVGPSSIFTDLKCLRKRRATISLVGFLGGLQADWNSSIFLELLSKAVRLQGILGGSRTEFEDLNIFLEEKKVKLTALVDRVFDFDDSQAAFEYLEKGEHVGKVVIQLKH